MKKIRDLLVAACVVSAVPVSAMAQTVSELVGQGYVTVHIAVAPNGQWAWMYLGQSSDKPEFVCQIEPPKHPNPADTCRKLN